MPEGKRRLGVCQMCTGFRSAHFDCQEHEAIAGLAQPTIGRLMTAFQARASRIMLKGVSAARRMFPKPPAPITSRSLASPACAPNAAPTSWDRDVGTHTRVEAA